jgi:hypothetical protein
MALTPEQKAFRQRWAEALQSGKYTQTAGALHNEKGFCCLGVACDLLGVKWEPGCAGEMFYEGPVVTTDGQRTANAAVPDIAESELMGLTPSDVHNLTVLNDDKMWDFAQIAEAVLKEDIEAWVSEKVC